MAAGVTGDALIAAIADMEANTPEPIVAAAVPSKGALRTRAYRERHKASQSVTCDECDAQTSPNVTVPAPSSPPLLSPQTPQTTPPLHPHPEGITTHAKARISFSVAALIVAECEKMIAARRKPKISIAFPCPDDVDPAHWADLMANRKSKRLPNTATALKGILRDLAKFSDDEWPPGRIVEHAAERGWGAIFDPRPRDGNRNGTRAYHDRPSAWGGSHLPLGATAASLDED